MFCSTCGKEITEGAEFCQNCGTRLSGLAVTQAQGSAALAPEAVPVPGKKPGSKKKIWIIAAMALVLVVIVGAGTFFLLSASRPKVEGRYYNISLEDLYYEFTPNENDPYQGTYKSGGMETKYDMYGTFVAGSGEVTITAKGGTKGSKIIVSGDYLIFEYSILKGAVPAEKTFDGTFEMNLSEGDNITKETYTFKEDGTYSVTRQYSESKTKDSGTYERVNDKIILKKKLVADVTVEYTLLVYNNRIAISVYRK